LAKKGLIKQNETVNDTFYSGLKKYRNSMAFKFSDGGHRRRGGRPFLLVGRGCGGHGGNKAADVLICERGDFREQVFRRFVVTPGGRGKREKDGKETTPKNKEKKVGQNQKGGGKKKDRFDRDFPEYARRWKLPDMGKLA